MTLYSFTSHFQYKMQPTGYKHDLINDSAKSQGLKLGIKVAENPVCLIEMSETDETGAIVYPTPISNELKQKIIYYGRGDISSQVLIQWINKSDKLLTDVTQLTDKSVYIKSNTKYFKRLRSLGEELGRETHI